MSETMSPADRAKDAAAAAAVALVEDGMRIGLGTGSTAAFFLRRLGTRIGEEELRVEGVPTSEATERLARELGIAVRTLEETGWLDLAVDGADEVDGDLTVIKGGGGALLREKIVAAAADRMVVIADAGKRVATLGSFPLPVEIVPFGWTATRGHVEAALDTADVSARGIRRREREGAPVRTDQGNFILDLSLGRIGDPGALSLRLLSIPGVVETGIFAGLCDLAIFGGPDGATETLERSGALKNLFAAV